MLTEKVNDYEVMSNGERVWINDSKGCVAAFKMEYTEIPDMNATGEAWLFRADHERELSEHWNEFKAKVKEFFGIDIPEQHTPKNVAPEVEEQEAI